MKKVLVVMGSDSDLKVMEKCVDRLKSSIFRLRSASAPRTALRQLPSSWRRTRQPKASALSLRQQARLHTSAVYWRLTPRFR